MPAKSTKKESAPKQKFVVARSEDGTIQITFQIPYKKIKLARETAVKKLGENIQVPGFRKGKAPIEKVIPQIPQNTLIEKTLAQILPKLISEAINQHKIRPVIYPKLELIKATEGEDWQVRATTCELPKITLGDYKKTIMGSARAKTIWTPDSAKASPAKSDKELSKEEKEQEVIKLLLKNIEIKIPKLLIEEEVASRLSNLLARLEKLGLNLESYLASIGKTPETLRKEYEKQAREAISLELILNKIIETEKIKIEESQVEAAIKASGADPELAKKLDTPEQRRVIRSVLLRRAALESLASLL
jgi:trigger factor